jgi:excisionase family DNA binding protein
MNTEFLSGWMTVSAAAKALGIREDYCRLLINNGKINARKLGQQWLVHTHAVRKYSRNMSKRKQIELQNRLESEE